MIEAMEYYDNAAMPMNRVLLLNELLVCTVKNRNFKKAGDCLVEMGIGKKVEGYLLMAWVCYYINGEERDDIYEMMGEDAKIVDLIVENEMEEFDERVRKRLGRITNKDVFYDIVDVLVNEGCVIDTR